MAERLANELLLLLDQKTNQDVREQFTRSGASSLAKAAPRKSAELILMFFAIEMNCCGCRKDRVYARHTLFSAGYTHSPTTNHFTGELTRNTSHASVHVRMLIIATFRTIVKLVAELIPSALTLCN